MENNIANYSPSNSAQMSDDIRAFGQAFLQAKKEFRATGLSGSNSHQKYTYAKIGDIYDAVETGLAKNNIAIWHMSHAMDNGDEILLTRLTHTITGQHIQDSRYLVNEKPGNQAKGATNTYMRKYAVLCLCAIATEDDDGADEEKYIAHRKTISAAQSSELKTMLRECANVNVLHKEIVERCGVANLESIDASDFVAIKQYIIDNKINKKGA